MSLREADLAGAAIEPLINPDPRVYTSKTLSWEEREQGNQLGIKESKLVPIKRGQHPNPRFKPRSLRDLQGYRPTQLTFSFPHSRSGNERNDAWFELLFRALFARVLKFADEYVVGDFSPLLLTYWWSPWSEGFSEHFLNYASEIARKDGLVGGWDHMLMTALERRYLVIGIIAKVLNHNVFDDLLFGKDENQGLALDLLDRKNMLTNEGYYRKAERAREAQRYFIGTHNILTPRFWREVDRLATRTTALLLPVVNLQGHLSPTSDWPPLRCIHQDLHNIIAHAGYLSISMALSTSIFRITFPEVGQTWDSDQDHFSDLVYQTSKSFGDEFDRDLARRSNAAKPRADGSEQRRGRGKRKTKNAKKEEEDGVSGLPMRVAKVKYVLWPSMKRYKPRSAAGAHGVEDGETISSLFNSQVAYYSGRLDEQSEMAEAGSLHDHVRRFSGRRTERWLRLMAVALVPLIMFVWPIWGGPNLWILLDRDYWSTGHILCSSGWPVTPRE